MGIFGLSFGASKEKSKTSSTSNLFKNEQTEQATDSTKSGTTTGSQSTAVTNTSAGSSSSTQQQTGATTGTKVGSTTATTNLFGAEAMAGLENLFQTRLGNAAMQADAGVDLGSFDVNSFVGNATAAATTREKDGLDTLRGSLGDQIGGGLNASSMAQLLFSKGQNESAARIGTATNEASLTANQIADSRAKLGLAANAADNDVLLQVGQLLKGAQATSSQGTTEGTTGTTSQTATGTTNTAETSQQNTQTNSIESITELVKALMSGNTTTNGTETTKGTSSGTKLSLSGNVGK